MTQILSPKACSKCCTFKSRDQFSFHKGTKDKLYSWCRSCVAQDQKERRAANPEKYKEQLRRSRLKNIYGLTIKEYDKMLQEQSNACAICKTTDTSSCRGGTFHVDHNHDTGKVRQLLCHKCNTAIGLLNEDPFLFDAAKKYLERHRTSCDQVA